MEYNRYAVVIGEAGCGMTSLLKKMSEGEWGGRPDTMCTATFSTPDAGLTLRLIELNNYTRGVKNMANLYISMSQIVIIIKDCSTSDNSERMLANIEKVRKVKPTVPIVLVTSKCDQGPLRKSDDGYSLFSHISTSCKTDLGIDDLKKALFRAAFPTEMKASEKWYNVIKTWEVFGKIFGNHQSSKSVKIINGGIQKKTVTPVLPRKSIDISAMRAGRKASDFTAACPPLSMLKLNNSNGRNQRFRRASLQIFR